MSRVKVSPGGSLHWINKAGSLHREGDKPALICASGTQCWFKNGAYHRDNNKPAIIWFYGRQDWHENGEFIRSTENG